MNENRKMRQFLESVAIVALLAVVATLIVQRELDRKRNPGCSEVSAEDIPPQFEVGGRVYALIDVSEISGDPVTETQEETPQSGEQISFTEVVARGAALEADMGTKDAEFINDNVADLPWEYRDCIDIFFPGWEPITPGLRLPSTISWIAHERKWLPVDFGGYGSTPNWRFGFRLVKRVDGGKGDS